MNADALKAWRQRMGYSQQEAAEALGSSLATIQSAETGRRPVAPMMALACEALERRLAADSYDMTAQGHEPAQGDAPGPNDVLSLQQSIDDICARLTTLEAAAVFNKKWQDAGNKAFEQLGHRVQMLELRAGKAAPSLSESDIGMIARRAARSVLPD